MNGLIYIHSNQSNGKIYVGQTQCSLRIRNNAHISDANYFKTPFCNAIRKYTWDGFDHQIAVDGISSQEELDNLERLWIIVLRAANRSFGYNLESGGRRIKTVSIPTRQKISTALQGHCVSVETRKKISEATKRRFSAPENRLKHSDRLRKYSPEERILAHRASDQKWRRKKFGPPRDRGKWPKGVPRSAETKRKISLALTGTTWSDARRAACL